MFSDLTETSPWIDLNFWVILNGKTALNVQGPDPVGVKMAEVLLLAWSLNLVSQ